MSKEKKNKSDEREIEILDATAGGGSGTLVIWQKIDRLLKSYKNKGSQKNIIIFFKYSLNCSSKYSCTAIPLESSSKNHTYAIMRNSVDYLRYL